MRRKPELMQLEIGMSTSRYLPASGTAGLARSLVSGKSRVPWPPPMITERTLLVFADWRPVLAITNPRFGTVLPSYLYASPGGLQARSVTGRILTLPHAGKG